MKYYGITLAILLMIMCGCNKKKIVNLGKGFRFDIDPVISKDCVIFGPYENTYAVSGHVSKFNFDSTFIIVEQKPRDLIMKDINTNSDLTFKEQERIFEESSLRQFWVINKINDSIYGPFERQEYLKKREVLGVPAELKLN
jgi:hypothetical protein